jgi:hypothetical protein
MGKNQFVGHTTLVALGYTVPGTGTQETTMVPDSFVSTHLSNDRSYLRYLVQ